MPQIMRLKIAQPPGVQYQYSNVGYLLLGQLVEAMTGTSYERECGGRILARAGIKNPALDRVWGELVHSAGGWALSGPEYLGFARLLRGGDPDILSPKSRRWMEDPQGKWVDDNHAVAYTLGVQIRVLPNGKLNIFHNGSWRLRSGATASLGRRGAHFVSTHDGVAWFVSFDGLSDEDTQAYRDLDGLMWRARRAATSWPSHDEFTRMGVGPLSRGRP